MKFRVIGTLSERIESIQRRALRIIFPSIDNYNEAMMMAQIPTFESRRELLCKKYMTKMKKEDHPLHFMLPKPKMSECRYILRNGQDNTALFKNTIKCRTLRSEHFFTFKYF